jgi:AcrR family transcriptional regulator
LTFNRSIKILIERLINRIPAVASIVRLRQNLPEPSKERLLAATERVVLREGAQAVSLRRIAAESGLNSALVSYHFGSLVSLLAQLLKANVDAICDARATQIVAARKVRNKGERLESLIAAHNDPLWLTPAVWHAQSARPVIRQLFPILNRKAAASSIQRINGSLEDTARELAELLPHLTHDVLMLRLRLLASATEAMMLEAEQMGLYPLDTVPASKREEALRAQLMQFSLGALRAS